MKNITTRARVQVVHRGRHLKHVRQAGLGVLAAAGLAGCAAADQAAAPTPAESFQEALQVCRLQHTGRVNRRLADPPDESHVAQCLARKGWSTDGQRITDGDGQ